MIDSHVEDAIALEVASGMPAGMVVAKFGLSSKAALTELLQESQIIEKITAYREYLVEAAAISMAKRSLAVDRIMDDLIARAEDRSDTFSARIGMWLVDGTTPAKSISVEHSHHVDIDVVADLKLGVAKLHELQASRSDMFEITEGDKHLEFGQDHIGKRDLQLAELGSVSRDE